MMKEYPVKGETVTYLSQAEISLRLISYGMSTWRAKLTRAYCFSKDKTIFIAIEHKEDKALLEHERGHLRGFDHTYYPTLMFPSWIGRLFKTYYPYKIPWYIYEDDRKLEGVIG